MAKDNPIIVALDSPDPNRIMNWALAFGSHAGMLKIGLEAFIAGGPDLVRDVGNIAPVFLDLKLHDIPNTVAGAMRVCDKLGVALVTVHASGGGAMMEAAVQAAKQTKVLGVTVLTSNDEHTMMEIGQPPVAQQVRALSMLTMRSGAAGVVCAPSDIGIVRQANAGSMLIVTPGIRPAGAPIHDQHRVATPAQAMEAGATHLVIGRPITQSDAPATVLQEVLAQVNA